MSSLAGALASPPPQQPKAETDDPVIQSEDVDMDTPGAASQGDEDQDQEMGDLFGEDNEVENAKQDEYVDLGSAFATED